MCHDMPLNRFPEVDPFPAKNCICCGPGFAAATALLLGIFPYP